MLNFSYPEAQSKDEVLAKLNQEEGILDDCNYRATVFYKQGKKVSQFIKYENMRWLSL